MFKIYCDESVNQKIVGGLKRRGVNVISAKDLKHLGLTDEEQLGISCALKACLFTVDDDFLKISREWSEQGKEHCGIIYSHPLKLSIGECISLLEVVASIFDLDEIKNRVEYL